METTKKPTVGTFFELGGRGAMEALTHTGLDYAIIDTEHGCFTAESAADFIVAAENGGLLPYVRIGEISRQTVLHMLDIGARGLIVPNVHSAEEVRQLVEYARFAPLGNRGFCPNRTSGWGAADWAEDPLAFMEESNRRCRLIPQCETKEALEDIENIASIPGIDGIFVGPCDLSIALGIPLQFDNPILLAAIERILKACRTAGIEAYIFAGNLPDAEKWVRLGFDSIAYSLDAAVLIQAFQGIVEKIKK